MKESELEASIEEVEMEYICDHLTMRGHKVADLEQIESLNLGMGNKEDYQDFETWCCVNRNCNYLELRLKEGHREDR